MDNWRQAADGNGNREKSIMSRNSSKKTSSPSTKAEAALTSFSECSSINMSPSAASPHHAMMQETSGPSINLENEERSLTLEEIIELGDDCLGLKVLITSNHGSFFGVINLILAQRRNITLEKVCNLNTGKKKLGLRTFAFQEVLNIKLLGEDLEARQRLLKDMCNEKQQGNKLLRNKLLPIKKQNSNNNMSRDEVVSSLQHLVREEALAEMSHLSPSPSPPPGKLPWPSKWIIIDVVDDAYKMALCIICKEMVISIGAAGKNLSRSGTLVWLVVATSNLIFHFDVAKIGASEAMEAGLGAVLQNCRIVKVMHDCRALEDFLHHQLKLNLCNVFDTQVAEIYLYLLKHEGTLPVLVPTLPSLITKYLSVDHYNFYSNGQENCKIADSLWLERPLVESLGERLARDIMFLRELRVEQLDVLLVDLRRVTEVYLGSMRDRKSMNIDLLQTQIVPKEVQEFREQRESWHTACTVPQGLPKS